MAPRTPETRTHAVARLRAAVAAGRLQTQLMAIGHHHTTHVVCLEDGRLRVRAWVLDPEKGRAFLAEHGHFMPEDAEAIGEPGPAALIDVDTIEALLDGLVASGII